ncbi:Olfactory receptor 2L5 [Heterocephalus glaber]|uniref:Olfactory receptor 2L5 n=1 Tax=Heterocephalus glaber TaxID=10181 RepID=G5ANY5_HETGA|nr:Olfactory receptor 2L5 [Heterocephalus glaber]
MDNLIIFTQFLLMDVTGSWELQILQGVEIAFLVVMSYDYHMTICSPLHYGLSFTLSLCSQATAGSWTSGLVYCTIHTGDKSYECNMENCKENSIDFFLMSLFPPSSLGLFLFTLTIPTFLLTLFGKLCMVLLILLDSQLPTPMYFLLSQLSLMDLIDFIYICTTVPKMDFSFLFGNKSISFIVCGVQCYIFVTLAGSEGLILMSMPYDHYVVICFPLHYPIPMNRRVCGLMILGSWAMGAVNSWAHTVYVLHIPYCRSMAINHFFCDIPAMVTLACGDAWVYEYTVFVSTNLFLVLPFLGILCSCGKTISLTECAAQIFLYLLFAEVVIALLVVMSYYHYKAICHCLHYGLIITLSLCSQATAGSWASDLFYSAIHTRALFRLPFTKTNEIKQYFCDVPHILRNSSSDVQFSEFVIIALSVCLGSMCFKFKFVSYVNKFSTVLKTHSVENCNKPMSTCTPQLAILLLFPISGLVALLGPIGKKPSLKNLLTAMFYRIVPPFLNPIIYCLHNREINAAL